ncbi:hypothetical protein BDR06DRAFT_1008659 [Suillus hirtellus]|nr:hypothetical protein BDR06DRAFT_1008659 [Suillus hirtellus]
MYNTPAVVPPFYDSETGAPLPFPPMLTDQLELFGHVDRRPLTLIADEVLVPKASSIIPTARASLSMHAPEFKLAKPHSCVPVPVPIPVPVPVPIPQLLNFKLLEDLKIPKPPSEPGRPGRGGYTLHEVLDWNLKLYSKFKKNMNQFIEDHLDTTKCASAQSPALLNIVRDKALNSFPDLENYSNLWPVNDIIMTRLKYMSGRARRKEGEMAVGKSKSKSKSK